MPEVLSSTIVYTTSFDTLDFKFRGPIQSKSTTQSDTRPKSTPVSVTSSPCVNTRVAYFPHQQLKYSVRLGVYSWHSANVADRHGPQLTYDIHQPHQ